MHFMPCCDKDGFNTFDLPLSTTESFYLTAEEVIEKFKDVLTLDEIEELKGYKMGIDPYDDKKSGDSFGNSNI